VEFTILLFFTVMVTVMEPQPPSWAALPVNVPFTDAGCAGEGVLLAAGFVATFVGRVLA
jgi:hypothetical protein